MALNTGCVTRKVVKSELFVKYFQKHEKFIVYSTF